jgi:hypothetical protein
VEALPEARAWADLYGFLSIEMDIAALSRRNGSNSVKVLRLLARIQSLLFG